MDEGNQIFDSRNNCNAIITRNNNTLVAGCKNSVIPNEVTAIASGAFQGCTGLTSVTVFSSNLKSIGSSAFANCDGLTSITIPSTVTSVGQDAFNSCDGLQSVTYEANVAIPEGLFRNCSALSAVNINPSSPVSIGKWAFRGCESLEEIDLRNANSVGEEAFLACTGLETITMDYFSMGMPIGKRAFFGCSALTDVSDHFIANEIGDSAFVDCVSLDTLVFVNSVSRIGHHAFQGCTGLKTIGSKDYFSLETIADSAFYNCSSLESFCLSSLVTPPTLGKDVFGEVPNTMMTLVPRYHPWDYNLTDEEYRNMYTDAGFRNPVNLYDVEENFYTFAKNQNNDDRQIKCTVISSWPDDCIATIGGRQYNDGSSEPQYEEHIWWDDEGNEHVDYVPMYPPEINENLSFLEFLEGDQTIYLPSESGPYKITSISSYAFGPSYSTEDSPKIGIVVPDGITEICEYAFIYCEYMNSVILPESVTKIGDGAFQSCSYLPSITLPSHLDEMGGYLFQYCNKLETCILPENIETIPRNCFSESGLKEISIPESVTMIDLEAFLYTSLTSIVLPPNLESIGYRAFAYTNLGHVDIPSKVTSIDNYAFSDCPYLDYLDLSHLTGFTTSVDMIGGGMMIFAPKSIGIPDSYNRINVAYYNSSTDTWHCLEMHITAFSYGTYCSPYDFIADKINFNGWGTPKNQIRTMYFPFAIPDVGTLGKVYAYDDYDTETGIVTFNRVMQMEPHVPYIFIPFDDYFNEKDLVLYNIDVKNTNGLSSEEKIGFNGVYSAQSLSVTASDNIYGFNWSGELIRATGTVGLSTFIAYLKLPEGASARSSFNDNTTSISNAQHILMEDESWYSITGQAQDSKKLKSGMYIHNGKKVIIR